jgi:SAM-dependent methyltransferase
MSDIAAEGPNRAQIANWNGRQGETYTRLQAQVDRELAATGQAAIDALAPKTGEIILDIGCGGGGTCLDLASYVGPSGQVIGVDISRPQLELARRRAETAGLASQVSFVLADAQTHPFERGFADGLYSRFGVMLFADPVAAFVNLRTALKPGGRLSFVCWREAADNPAMNLALEAAVAVAPELAPPPPQPVPGPGPYAFADPVRVRQVLHDAGYFAIDIRPHDAPTAYGALDEALAFMLRIGGLAGRLRQAPHLEAAVTPAVRQALAAHIVDGEVRLRAAVWIVTARTA